MRKRRQDTNVIGAAALVLSNCHAGQFLHWLGDTTAIDFLENIHDNGTGCPFSLIVNRVTRRLLSTGKDFNRWITTNTIGCPQFRLDGSIDPSQYSTLIVQLFGGLLPFGFQVLAVTTPGLATNGGKID
jgi:hypothetical protein